MTLPKRKGSDPIRGFRAAKQQVATRATAAIIAAPGSLVLTGWALQFAGLMIMRDTGMVDLGGEMIKAGHYISEGGVLATGAASTAALKDFHKVYVKESAPPPFEEPRRKVTPRLARNQNHKRSPG